MPPVLEVQSLNQWTARKVPFFFFFIIHFELTFVDSMKYGNASFFFFFPCFSYSYWIVSTPLVEKIILSPLNYFDSLVENQLTTYTWVYFWTLYSVACIYMFIFTPIPQSLNYCSIKIYLEIRYCNPSTFLFFFFFNPFHFLINVKIQLVSFYNWGSIDILISSLSVHDLRYISTLI